MSQSIIFFYFLFLTLKFDTGVFKHTRRLNTPVSNLRPTAIFLFKSEFVYIKTYDTRRQHIF